MDVRGANTFPLHNRFPILYLLVSYNILFYIRRFYLYFPVPLEQIKLGGDFIILENTFLKKPVITSGDFTGDNLVSLP